MARIKLAYVGGGSTRGPGTVASIIAQGENFAGSEVVLIDLDAERLAIVRAIAEKMARNRGVDLAITTTTDRRAGLADCDAVLTSFRAGGFEARVLDESIPLSHGVIGQETQGPGGFFMALRSIHIMKGIVADMEAVCPRTRLFNYTNPINLVSQAVTRHTDIPTISLCEGPFIYPRTVARAADLDPDRVDSVMVGLNHGSWTVRHLYDGQDIIPLIQAAWERKRDDPDTSAYRKRILHMAAAMGSIGADYFQYYLCREELLAELTAKPTTRAQDILAHVPDYWEHYREQAAMDEPALDPELSRGGINELELAIDVMDAVFNDRGEVWPVNVPNNGALPDFPDDQVVEIPGYVDRHGATPLPYGRLPVPVRGITGMLAEYQSLAADAAWDGTRIDAVRALASNPLVMDLRLAETLYDEMSAAHRDLLPDRLVA